MTAVPNPIIYLDYAATTPVDDRVLQAMLPYFQWIFGNSSSVHTFGQQAEAALEAAREKIATALGCSPGEVLFTSCGTESDNLALRGTAISAKHERGANHLLISPVEHHAISKTAEQLASIYGFELEFLPVDSFGMVDPQEVAKRLRADTALVSVIYANNEIGTINPIAEIGAICRGLKIPFHSDAVQAAAYLPVDTSSLNVDLLSLGAHKFYGPKGIGALYVNKTTTSRLTPIQTGGGQEFGLRAGTHNIPYIVGMAEALHLAQTERMHRIDILQPIRDYLIGNVLENVPDTRLTGHPTMRMPNHASFVFENVDGNALLTLLDVEGFACSSGSACKTGNPEPSEVLIAMGISRSWALGSLRVTLGLNTTSAQVERFVQILPGVIERIRRTSQHPQ
jgi:cysteine desulfurase